jgi:uncharacterized cupin superfamily protein
MKPMSKKSMDAMSLTAQTDNPFPDVFHAKMGPAQVRALSDAFGLQGFGVNLEVVVPGASSGLRHWHTRSEEFVYVLSGELTLHYGEQVETMTAGACVGFKANEGLGHRLVNHTDKPAMFMVVGSRVDGDQPVYDEDDFQWNIDANGQWVAAHKDGTPYSS